MDLHCWYVDRTNEFGSRVTAKASRWSAGRSFNRVQSDIRCDDPYLTSYSLQSGADDSPGFDDVNGAAMAR